MWPYIYKNGLGVDVRCFPSVLIVPELVSRVVNIKRHDCAAFLKVHHVDFVRIVVQNGDAGTVQQLFSNPLLPAATVVPGGTGLDILADSAI